MRNIREFKAVAFWVGILCASATHNPQVEAGRSIARDHGLSHTQKTSEAPRKSFFSKFKSKTPHEAPAERVAPPRQEEAPKKEGFFSKLFKKNPNAARGSARTSGPQFPGSIAVANRSSDVTLARFIDARYIDARMKGNLKGKGLFIIQTARKYGFDPVFFASIMAFETGWGTSKALRSYNNPGGMMTGRQAKQYIKFPTVEAGIDAMGANLKAKYLNENRKTISSIASKYAPVGARNDPRRTNHLWPGSVSKIMNIFIQGSLNMGNQAAKPERLT